MSIIEQLTQARVKTPIADFPVDNLLDFACRADKWLFGLFNIMCCRITTAGVTGFNYWRCGPTALMYFLIFDRSQLIVQSSCKFAEFYCVTIQLNPCAGDFSVLGPTTIFSLDFQNNVLCSIIII